MKKKLSLFLIIALIAILALGLVACNEEADPVYKFDLYTAYDITNVQITQKAEYTLEHIVECDIAPSDTAKVYVTRYNKIPQDATPIEYAVEDGKYVFTQEIKYATYYLYVIDGNKTAVLPLTRPQMAPTVTEVDEYTNVISFKFANGTSWSSFCDPTGKAVYRSSKPAFDTDATLVEQKMGILVESSTDVSVSADEPYYYVVLSAKNGIVKYISAPFMALDKAYSDINVSLKEKEGKPYLQVDGKFVIDGEVAVELYSADEKLGKVFAVKGYSKSGQAGEDFSVDIAAMQIISENAAGIWYDIKLVSGMGAQFELSKSVADLTQVIDLEEEMIKFSFKEYYGVLKLNYDETDYILETLKIENDENGVPTLVVKGKVSSGVTNMRLQFQSDQATGNKKDTYYFNNISEESGRFEFAMKLTAIPLQSHTPWCWFHIYVSKANSDAEKPTWLENSGKIAANQSWTYNGVKYSVRANDTAQFIMQAENA